TLRSMIDNPRLCSQVVATPTALGSFPQTIVAVPGFGRSVRNPSVTGGELQAARSITHPRLPTMLLIADLPKQLPDSSVSVWNAECSQLRVQASYSQSAKTVSSI